MNLQERVDMLQDMVEFNKSIIDQTKAYIKGFVEGLTIIKKVVKL